MPLSHLSKIFSAALLVASAAEAFSLPQNVPPKPASNVRMLGKTKDPNFNVNIYRDGGSSVYANGYHMMIFADTIVDKNGPTPNSALVAHNSLAYFGYDDKGDPTIMHDFGSQTPHTMDTVLDAPFPTIPDSNETSNYGIWPSSNMAVLSDGITAVGMFHVFDLPRSKPVYTTMVTAKVEDPKSLGNGNPTTHRLVNQFFYEGEPLFGGLSIIRGLDGLLYMFASVPTGVKLARVQEDQMTDRSKYEYWNGLFFQSEMPALDNVLANVAQFTVPNGLSGEDVGPDVGDVFWSEFHKTYLMVFMDGRINGQYWVAYSPDGSLTTWSKPEMLWAPSPNPTWTDECTKSGMGGQWNYGGHAHPHWDPSGRTLLLSWASCTVWVNMAVVSWESSGLLDGLKGAASTGGKATSSASAATSASATATAASSAATTSTSTPKATASLTSPNLPSDSPVSGGSSSDPGDSSAHSNTPAEDTSGSVLSLGQDGAARYRAVPDTLKVRERAAEDRTKFMLRRRQDWSLLLRREPNL